MNDFIKFLELNLKSFKDSVYSQKRFDWKGEECAEASSLSEKFNYFCPEFATYLASKICEQNIQYCNIIPLHSGPLYLAARSRVNAILPFSNFQLITKTFAHSRSASNIRYASDKGIFITAGDDGCVCIWNGYNAELLEKIQIHSTPVNVLKYFKEDQLLVTADTSGNIKIISLQSSFDIRTEFDLGREVDKLHLFWVGDQLRMFCALKNGPYVIFAIDGDESKEIFRSGASYKESSILKSEDLAFFVVKTNSGLFSINFCRESQETWFLVEDDPLFLLSNRKSDILFALCKEGKILELKMGKEDVKPSVLFERSLNYDFAEANLIQIFETMIVCAKFEGEGSYLVIISIEEQSFLEIKLRIKIPKICYFVRENPFNNNILAMTTVDGSLLFLNVQTGAIFLEKRLSAAINDLLFSDDGKSDLFPNASHIVGRTLALLDDSGSVTFYSSAFMPCDNSTLKIVPDGYDPKSFTSHLKLRSLLKPQVTTTHKRKRENQSNEKRKRAKETPKAAIEDVEELDHLPYWSSVYTNQAQPFVPQLGDVVIYFFKPHLDFLKRNGRKLKESIEYEDILPFSRPYLEGTIEAIEYPPAELVKCQIVLKVMIGRKSFRCRFSYFFGIPQPNYLVLKSAFSCNLDQRFKSNETVKILSAPCQGESGIILDIEGEDPTGTFNAYKILCKKREITVYCSHWEISKLRGGQPVEAKPLDEEVFGKLKELMQPILEDERWLAFRYPVDFSEYPEYYATVPYPMYLEIIHKRLHHRYYRHAESFLWDIKQIAVDALIFNEPGSDIVKEADDLVELVESLCKLERLIK